MPRRDDEPDALDTLRAVAVAVFIVLSALLVIANILGRAASDAFTGLTFGTLLALLGIEGLERLVRRDGES